MSFTKAKLVASFGGDAVANASKIKQVIGITQGNPGIHCCVFTTPNKRWENNVSLSDIITDWHTNAQGGASCKSYLFKSVFEGLAAENLPEASFVKFKQWLQSEVWKFDREFVNGKTTLDYAWSRGGYVTAKLMADILDWEFIDLTNTIIFNDGSWCEWEVARSFIVQKLSEPSLNGQRLILPSLWGEHKGGLGVTPITPDVPDVTGKLVADALGFELQSWEDITPSVIYLA